MAGTGHSLRKVFQSTFASDTGQKKADSRMQVSKDGMHPLRLVLYYTGWSIYARQFFPEQMPFEKTSHVNYAFGRIRTDGTVFMDPHEVAFTFPHERRDLELLGGALYQLFSLKTKYRHTKVLLSIGGWSERDHWQPALATSESRSKFINSAVNVLEDFGFDGLDLDYEFPTTAADGVALEALVKDLRKELDHRAKVNGYPPGTRFLLTLASPAYTPKLTNYRFNEIASYLDFINVMGYDLAGPWDSTVGHMSRLFGGLSVSDGIKGHIKYNVPRDKIVMGVPLYGRSYAGIEKDGSPYSENIPFTGPGTGSYEKGVLDYRDIMRLDCDKTFNKEFGATHCYDRKEKQIICFDDSRSVAEKTEYIHKERLGGMMFWEANGDSKDSSLVEQFASANGNNLEKSENCIIYPKSKFFNIRSKPHKRLADPSDTSADGSEPTNASYLNSVPSRKPTIAQNSETGLSDSESNIIAGQTETSRPIDNLQRAKTKKGSGNRQIASKKLQYSNVKPTSVFTSTPTSNLNTSKTSFHPSKQTIKPSSSSKTNGTSISKKGRRRRLKCPICRCNGES